MLIEQDCIWTLRFWQDNEYLPELLMVFIGLAQLIMQLDWTEAKKFDWLVSNLDFSTSYVASSAGLFGGDFRRTGLSPFSR